MYKKHLFIVWIITFGISKSFAQTSLLSTLNKHYKAGLELFSKEKYVAAVGQFSLIETERAKPNTQPESNAALSMIKENAKFYKAVCAIELGNDDAENQTMAFMRDYPLNPNTKLACFYMGKSYYAKNNYEKAIEWFEKSDPGTLSYKQKSEYQFKQGYAYFEQKNYEKAEPLFEAVKKQPSNFQEDAIYYFAYINYLNQEYKTALSNFEKLKGSPTYQASYPYYITSMYYLDARYDEVIDYALPVMKKTPQKYETEMLSLVAASYFAKEDYQNAQKYFSQFYTKDKWLTKNNLFIYQYGYALLENKKSKEAIKILERLTDDDVYLQNGMFILGKAALQINEKEKARSAFFRASRLTFDENIRQEAWFNYAKLSYELNFNQQALESIQNFIKELPNSKKINEAKILLSQILLTSKDYQRAVDIIEPIKNETPETQAVYQKVTYFRGLQFYNERAFPNALSMFLRSETYPEDDEIYALSTYWKAESMYELRKYDEAIATFEKFLNTKGSQKTAVYAYANYALGYAAFEGEKYNMAINYFRQFLKSSDNDLNTILDATTRLADSYFVNKNYTNALVYYDQIIANKSANQDYALFQKGMIQGLEKQDDAKIVTMQNLLSQFPKSNYSDDAGFEMAYTYFNKGDFDKSKADLTTLAAQYPHSSYIPRAILTIGLVQYNQSKDDEALTSFKKVINDYPSAPEAKQALETIKNIYIDRNDANGFLSYASTTPLGNFSQGQQDDIMFQSVKNLYLKGDAKSTYDAVNAYFDKFPKAMHDKEAKFIRAESLIKLNRTEEAIKDYDYILNDWTSDYTEPSLMSVSKALMKEKRYNDAIVYLKRLETTSEYQSNHNYAITNLIKAYNAMGMGDDMIKYAALIKTSDKASEEEKNSADLYAGKGYLKKADTVQALKAFNNVINKTKTEAAAEAKYNIAAIQYNKGAYKTSQKTCFDLINNMPTYNYWLAKSFILLADNYLALKDKMQAKSTLLSIIDNYENKEDDIIPTAKKKLAKIK